MTNKLTLVCLLSAMAMLAACATAPQSLVDARTQYETVEQNEMVNQYAPVELREAKLALERAEKEFEDEGDDTSTRALGYIAERQARLALIKAANTKYTREIASKKEMLLDQTDAARLTAQDAYEKERAIAILTRDQLLRERGQLDDAKKKLEAARKDGSMSAEQLKAMEASLLLTEQKLAAAEAERQALEAQLADAQSKLNEFAQVKEKSNQMIITLNGAVLFKVGESTLMPIAQNRLNEVAKVLKAQKDKPIVVEGHTDSQGKTEMNRELSLARATSVRNYLVSQGVDTAKITAVGLGETQPVADNDTPEGRANNRRVEIVVGSAVATTEM